MFPELAILITFLFDFQGLGNSQKEYEKSVVNFSVKNQLRYKGNLGKQYYIKSFKFLIIHGGDETANVHIHFTYMDWPF